MSEQGSAPEKRRFRLTKFWIFFIVLAVFWGIVYLLSYSQTVCDFYLDHIHPYAAAGISKVTYLIPVPLHELMMFAALLLGALLVILLILLIFLRKKPKFRRFTGNYVKAALVIGLCVGIGLLTFDSSMQHSSVLGHPDYQAKEHSQEEVKAFWDWYVTNINELQTQVRRDANHHFIRPTADEIQKTLSVTRQKLAAEYPRLKTDVPPEKTSLLSGWLRAYGIAAYTVSPTMEIVCTDRTEDRSYFASIYAHEYSHFEGFWREDEANYFGFRLCYESDDPNIRYAGFLDLYPDVAETFNKSYFGDAEVNTDDPGYLEYCEGIKEFDDVFLFLCDRSANYKKYHEMQGEENVVDEHREYAELSDGMKQFAQDMGSRHFDNLKEQLGVHYYDGVCQLIMDEMPAATAN